MNTIAVDAMGGDDAPDVVLEAVSVLSQRPDAPRMLLVGDEGVIEAGLRKHSVQRSKVSIVHTEQHIGMDADSRTGLQELPRASIVLAAQQVASGAADALVSAGNTGAVVLACARTWQRLPGVQRCALGAVFPTERRRGDRADPFSLILDAGLTLDASADDLVGFAAMGAAYARIVSRNPTPSVALLSNGTEPTKGPPAVVEANRRLQSLTGISGFVGNVVLKMLEGMIEVVRTTLQGVAQDGLMSKAGFALLAPGLRDLKKAVDWEQYGGAPLLGFEHVCIKAHGRSSPRAIRNAIRLADKAIEEQLVQRMRIDLSSSSSMASMQTESKP
jgi:phosphate acyltransferase